MTISLAIVEQFYIETFPMIIKASQVNNYNLTYRYHQPFIDLKENFHRFIILLTKPS